jgi:hypothetical protein
MLKNKNIIKILFLIIIYLPSASFAITMNSENYTIDSGRIGSSQFSSSTSSDNYATEHTDDITVNQGTNSSQDGSLDSDDDGNAEKSEEIQVRKNEIMDATDSNFEKNNQEEIHKELALIPLEQNGMDVKNVLVNDNKSFFWWTSRVGIVAFILLVILIVISKYRRKNPLE